MTTPLRPKAPATESYQAYVRGASKAERLATLQKLRQQGGVPIGLAQDLLLLDIGHDEKFALLECTKSHDRHAFEHFLTHALFDWNQNLGAAGVRLWARDTDHLLWFRLASAVASPLLPQRVMYTILDVAHAAGGGQLIERVVNVEGLNGLSSAFHSLLLQRALQWNVSHPTLVALARMIALSFEKTPGDHKSLPAALGYILRYDAPYILELLPSLSRECMWRDLISNLKQAHLNADEQLEKSRKFLAKPIKGASWQQLSDLWPALWGRGSVDHELLTAAMRFRLAQEKIGSKELETDDQDGSPAFLWEFLAGVPAATIDASLKSFVEDPDMVRVLEAVHPFMSMPYAKELLDLARQAVVAASDPALALASLPARLRQAMAATGTTSEASVSWRAIEREQTATLQALSRGEEVPSSCMAVFHETQKDPKDQGDASLYGSAHTPRRTFFALAFQQALEKSTPPTPPSGHGYFEQLTRHWSKPDENKLDDLAQAARQVEGLFRLCYIATLGRFKGQDQAALKLLDFIRSKEEDELRFVASALGNIGTPRALQELVATLTRPNSKPSLQLEICQILKGHDLTSLQSELRSAISDTKEGAHAMGLDEVLEAMTSLLSPAAAVAQSQSPLTDGKPAPGNAASDAQLDQALIGKIRHYRELSSEIKRALRTSQFFHMQVSAADAPESIDLSPVIDMQYKALELLFREAFEDPCARLIHRGTLQRRLDVIGYARPVPHAMDEFENYIGSLPIIREIPFFSKFKLRKMLRAICQYRPGKRFTLDGLKAFALFFLCFGRHECRYGLENLFPLGCKDDEELFQFVKEMHVLQDFRNRAAHEGFHPDASNDIDGIWRSTAEIVQNLFKVRQAFAKAEQSLYASPERRSDTAPKVPIVERKRVS